MTQHTHQAAGAWSQLPLTHQLSNVGSEVDRLISWQAKGHTDYAHQAFLRVHELLTLTINDPKHLHRLRELTRLREVLSDYYLGDNHYQTTPHFWQTYFLHHGLAARK